MELVLQLRHDALYDHSLFLQAVHPRRMHPESHCCDIHTLSSLGQGDGSFVRYRTLSILALLIPVNRDNWRIDIPAFLPARIASSCRFSGHPPIS